MAVYINYSRLNPTDPASAAFINKTFDSFAVGVQEYFAKANKHIVPEGIADVFSKHSEVVIYFDSLELDAAKKYISHGINFSCDWVPKNYDWTFALVHGTQIMFHKKFKAISILAKVLKQGTLNVYIDGTLTNTVDLNSVIQNQWLWIPIVTLSATDYHDVIIEAPNRNIEIKASKFFYDYDKIRVDAGSGFKGGEYVEWEATEFVPSVTTSKGRRDAVAVTVNGLELVPGIELTNPEAYGSSAMHVQETLKEFVTMPKLLNEYGVTWLKVHGNWELEYTDYYYPLLRSSAAGDYIEFEFIGTGLDVQWLDSVDSADLKVLVDGIEVTYTANRDNMPRLVSIVSELEYGTHRVKILNAGTASFTKLNLMALLFYAPAKASVVQSDDVLLVDAIEVSNAYWYLPPKKLLHTGVILGSGDYADYGVLFPAVGDYMEFYIAATDLAITFMKGPDKGKVNVIIDGTTYEVDLYDTAVSKYTYELHGLSTQPHHVAIEVIEKNPLSSGNQVEVLKIGYKAPFRNLPYKLGEVVYL